MMHFKIYPDMIRSHVLSDIKSTDNLTIHLKKSPTIDCRRYYYFPTSLDAYMVLPSIYASANEKIALANTANSVGLTAGMPKCHTSSPTTSSPTTSSDSNHGGSGKYTVADLDATIARDKNLDMHSNFELPFYGKDYSQHSLEITHNRVQDLDVRADPIEGHSEGPLVHREMVQTRVITTFVVDTNFIISHLKILEALRQLSSYYHHQIVIPLTVVQELDGLKNSCKLTEEDNGESVGSLARRANDWIYKNLANLDSSVLGQKVRQTIDKDSVKDDSILDCCLFFQDNLKSFVILLSNDKNLCLKALKEDIPTVSFRKGMSAQIISSRSYEENMARFGLEPSQGEDISMDYPIAGIALEQEDIKAFSEISRQVYCEISEAVTDATDFIMISEYGNDLELIGHSPNTLNNLIDVCKCFNRYWISIFGDYFKKSTWKQNFWKALSTKLTNMPADFSDLNYFKMFWSDVLHHLFSKRSDNDNDTLQLLINRWEYLIQQCKINGY